MSASAQPSILNRLRSRSQDERGVVLVLVAIMMTVFLGMAALAIDIGSFWQAQRQAQAAADAGALAAAQDLPNAATATTDATSYALKNFPTANTPVVTVNAAGTTVTVNVSANTPTFFSKVLGAPNSEVVGATAVAGAKPTTTPCATPGNNCDAIFASDSTCTSGDGIIGGGGNHITGGMHSNGWLDVGGGGSSFGPTTFGNGANCAVSPTGYQGQNNTFTSGPSAQAPITTWPIDYTKDFPPCSVGTNCSGACDVSTVPCPSSNQTPSFCTQASNAASESLVSYYPGTLTTGQIYCDVGSGAGVVAATPSTWNGAITASQTKSTLIDSSFVAGSVTFGGGSTISACGYVVSGYSASGCGASVPTPVTGHYPIVYATGAGTAIDEGSGGGTLSGDLFAPNGKVVVGGGTTSTFIEAKDVDLSAGGINISGDGPTISGGGGGSSGAVSLLQ